MKYRQIFKILLTLPFVFLLASCDPWDEDRQLNITDIDKTLDEIIASNANISTFAQILKLTGYDTYLQSQQSLTIFAPRNEALQGIDLQNTEALKEWMKNYIAKLTYFSSKTGRFEVESIEMINGKNYSLDSASISGTNIVISNIMGANGVIHIVDSEIIFRKSVWEYMQEQTGYVQVNYISSLQEKVMDLAKSIQNGVDVKGRPIYDTVWTYQNTFLETYPLNNENNSFTVVLIEQNVYDKLQSKYSRYFAQDDSIQQINEITRQISMDMLLKKTKITVAGRYPSFDNVLVDIDPVHITETYQASNGIVYKVNAADVKIFNNKIKEQIIEAEDYVLNWDERSAWLTRYRPWASGGKDVVLKGFTINTFDYNYYDVALDSTIHKTIDKTSIGISYRTNDPVWSRTYNPYLQFEPVMYSTSYEIRWVTYDDVEAHTRVTLDPATLTDTMTLEQKLFVSFPGKPVLRRESDGQVKNNFSSVTLMASSVKAGVRQEKQLIRYRKVDTSTPSTSNLYMLNMPYTFEDDYGKEGNLKCPAYGKATFWVSNTVREKGLANSVAARNPGIIFLDYIRLTPLVDPND